MFDVGVNRAAAIQRRLVNSKKKKPILRDYMPNKPPFIPRDPTLNNETSQFNTEKYTTK